MLVLHPVEARAVGALIEKEITTPEYYPLSLNALVNACNQKSSREPVMELSEGDLRSALFALEQQGLVRVVAEARVPKYEHRLRDPLQLRRDEIALLCLLLLRGPQTAAELRARADRLYTFDDTQAVSSTLERLASREDPVAKILPRQPGAREARWRHLLDGIADEEAVMATASASAADPAPSPADREGMLGRVAVLEQRVAALEQRLERVEATFGVDL